jgi:hypothetical protein
VRILMLNEKENVRFRYRHRRCFDNLTLCAREPHANRT